MNEVRGNKFNILFVSGVIRCPHMVVGNNWEEIHITIIAANWMIVIARSTRWK